MNIKRSAILSRPASPGGYRCGLNDGVLLLNQAMVLIRPAIGEAVIASRDGFIAGSCDVNLDHANFFALR
jgi:hypothetical protein